MARTIATALGLLAFALADGGIDPAFSQNAGAHPLSEILVSGPVFTDLQPDSVTVTIETRIPVVCAAVYGMTTAYGQLAINRNAARTSVRDSFRGSSPDLSLLLAVHLHRSRTVSKGTNPNCSPVAAQNVGIVGVLADGVRFELTEPLRARRFSRPVPSTTRPPIRLGGARI